MGGDIKVVLFSLTHAVLILTWFVNFKVNMYYALLYDWRESCLLIGPICFHKSLCLPENWSELAQKVI